MPRHPMPYVVDSAESAPSSLKASPSKRERVRKFLRRVSSFGHRTHKNEQNLSQGVTVAEAQAPGSVHDASSPEQHVIDLTVEPLPVKVLRRDSASSSTGSVLKHKAVGRLAAAAIDDASSFHSSAPSDSSASDVQSDSDKPMPESQPAGAPHVEPEQPKADTSAHEVELEIPPVHEALVDPASIPLPADEEEDFNPVPPVFLVEEAPAPVLAPEVVEPLPEVSEGPTVADSPVIIASDDTGLAPQEGADPSSEICPTDPFDDAYAADTESVSSASPELAPVVVLDIIETMELNRPADAPASVPAVVDPEPQLEEQPCTSKSSEGATEVMAAIEAIVPDTVEVIVPSDPESVKDVAAPVQQLVETVVSDVPAAEQQLAEVEAAIEAPSAPASDIPSVVIVAPSPTSTSEPSMAATKSAPSVSEEVSLSFPSSASSGSPSLTIQPARSSLVPLALWFRASLSALKAYLPGRRTALRWRTPACYGIAVMCYSLTWYLSRRPPVNVELNHFHMY